MVTPRCSRATVGNVLSTRILVVGLNVGDESGDHALYTLGERGVSAREVLCPILVDPDGFVAVDGGVVPAGRRNREGRMGWS